MARQLGTLGADRRRQFLVGLCSWLCIFSACGGVFSFGVYQDVYQSYSLLPNNAFTGASPAAIDMIGTLGAALMTAGAPLAAAWTKRFGPRRVILAGSVLCLTAAMLASVSQTLWQFTLAQGVLMGLGTCLSYLPAVTVSPTWYTANRGLAMGLILSGTGLGGLVWAPIIHVLIARLGFRNALRVAGGVTAGLVAMGSFVIDWDPASKARLEAERARVRARPSSRLRALWDVPLVDWRIARTKKVSLRRGSSSQ